MDKRRKLPPRRPSVTRDVIWTRAQGGEHRFSVTIGFDPVTGRVAEVFASPARGSDIDATIADFCVVLSHALQHGARAGAIAASMLQVSDPSSGGDGCFHASVLGAVVAAVAEAVKEGDALWQSDQ